MHTFEVDRICKTRSAYAINEGSTDGVFHGSFLTAYELAHMSDDFEKNFPRASNRSVAEDQVSPDKRLSMLSFYGGLSSVKQVTELIDKGWPEGVAKIEALREKIGDPLPNDCKPQNMRRRRCWSDDGDDVSYDRLMSGQLDTMWRTTERRASGIVPTVSIAFSWGGRGAVTQEQMLWGGATALAISDLFEESGYSVEIVAVNTTAYSTYGGRSSTGGKYTATCIQVKNTDEPMRIDTLATICCHAGVFRTFGFAAKMLSDVPLSGVGGTQDAATFDLSDFPLEGTAYVLPLIYSEGEAIRQIKMASEKMGSDGGVFA